MHKLLIFTGTDCGVFNPLMVESEASVEDLLDLIKIATNSEDQERSPYESSEPQEEERRRSFIRIGTAGFIDAEVIVGIFDLAKISNTKPGCPVTETIKDVNRTAHS